MTKPIVEQMSTYIHLSKYARWVEGENRRETWDETVDRFERYWMERLAGNMVLPASHLKELEVTLESVRRKNVMPSMRALMTAGKALDRDNAAGFNCAAKSVDHPRVFDELFYLLMCGTGVGYSVERQYINELPEIAEELHPSDTTIKVRDSKIGWAKGLKELIALLYNGDIPTWDLSAVRPAGARLKTFGGRASGPEPLDRLFKYTVNLFKNAKGRRLNSLECHDLLCKIADTVIVGSVRRSACISLSNLTDDRMRRAKMGDWWNMFPHRALANNSTAYTEKPDLAAFTKEMRGIYQSKAGERGIINKEALREKAESCGREYDGDYLLNPCFHPDTLIETVEGKVPIKDITEPTYVYSMDKDEKVCIKRASASFVTKRSKYVTVTYNNGESIRVTTDHKIYVLDKGWVEAGLLQAGDKLQGLQRYRRGVKYSGIKLSSMKLTECQMEHRLVWEGVNGVIPPDFDVHHVDNDGYNNTISNLECISHSSHASLTRYSCANDHQIKCKESGRFLGTGVKARNIVPLPAYLKANHPTNGLRVESVVESTEEVNVYDITVEGTHCLVASGIIAHNCGEAILRDSGGLCNLTEVIVRPDDTLETLKVKVKHATILGTLQSTLTSFRYLRKVWTDNQEEERLLGVSLTGIMDHPVMSGRQQWSNVTQSYIKKENTLVDTLKILKQVAKETNEEWSERLGIPSSKQLTLVKPSGTVSQLCGTSSGIHPRYAKYYIRRVTQDIKDPLTQLMMSQGVPYVSAPGEKVIFSFPIKSPDDAVVQADMGTMEQLELWKTYRDHWCEGNPSQTIYYDDTTFLDLQSWIFKNWDSIGGLSFFPVDDNIYENAPYEEVTEEQYEQLCKEFPDDIKWGKLTEIESEDGTMTSTEFACSGGNCEL